MEQTTQTITTTSPEEATVLVQILKEMRLAKLKHPTWPDCPVRRAAIVAEEAGEVVREANHILEGRGNARDLRTELIQTAGTCVRMLTLMDQERDKPTGRGLAAMLTDAVGNINELTNNFNL